MIVQIWSLSFLSKFNRIFNMTDVPNDTNNAQLKEFWASFAV
jgi:hypothetical protein